MSIPRIAHEGEVSRLAPQASVPVMVVLAVLLAALMVLVVLRS